MERTLVLFRFGRTKHEYLIKPKKEKMSGKSWKINDNCVMIACL